MDHTTMLTHTLKLHFGWHLARIKCLSCLIIALFKVKTVNFAELATAFSGSAKVDSHYRRIQRFFKEVELKQDTLARLVTSLLPYDQFVLSIDRTNWMLGCFAINFLVLSIVHQGTAFPVFWLLLPKKGNSNTKERIELINQFLDVFGSHKIQYLTGDREFIGQQWFAYLIKHQIEFRLRIKKNMMISRSNGQFSPAENFFRSLPLSTACQLIDRRWVCGHLLWVTGMRLASGDYLIVVTHDDSAHTMSDYAKRWKIEVLFESLKSRGFNFEDVNLKDQESLKRLLAVITIAFCWAYHVGAWLNEVKPIRVKKHQRPAKSVFRYGFDWIRHVLFNPEDKRDELKQVLTLLKNTITRPKGYIFQPYPMF
uniref:Transposase n=1 Tax=uncultured bacterium psy1 TaxID=693111 RepID=D2SUD5_9BACT|nr:transposase [uncultured bacterium psy1]ADA82594.1 transposase [uncultured bacterium psy1]